MPLTPGDKLGTYEILWPLGAGEMGEVYRARNPKPNRSVALKILPPVRANDADHLAALAIENGAAFATFDRDFRRFKGLHLVEL